MVSTTEDLGQAKSLLTVDELLEALSDPRFNVRFEAIISIARMNPDERLIRALIETLEGNDPAFSVMAAWGLGRMGDARAIEPLRRGLDAEYRSVRAHSARGLGALDDVEVRHLLLRRLKSETDEGLKIAYASVLGKLKAAGATSELLDLLRHSTDERSRTEVALALARILGDEHRFIQLFRRKAIDPGPAAAEVVTQLLTDVVDVGVENDALIDTAVACRDTMQEAGVPAGLSLLSSLIRELPAGMYEETTRLVLEHCAKELDEFGSRRIEYALLALHLLEAGRCPDLPQDEVD